MTKTTTISYIVELDLRDCIGCGVCVEKCPENAIPQSLIGYISSLATIDIIKCNGCGVCVPLCPYNAIKLIKKG